MEQRRGGQVRHPQRAQVALGGKLGRQTRAARNQHRSRDRYPALQQCVADISRAAGAPALAGQEHRRIGLPAQSPPGPDELGDRGHVADGAVELVVVLGLRRPAEPRPDRIDKNQVSVSQPGVVVVDQPAALKTPRTGGFEVQQDGGRARTAVPDEGQRPRRLRGDAIGRVEHEAVGLAGLGVADGHAPRLGCVLQRPAGDRDLVLGDGGCLGGGSRRRGQGGPEGGGQDRVAHQAGFPPSTQARISSVKALWLVMWVYAMCPPTYCLWKTRSRGHSLLVTM